MPLACHLYDLLEIAIMQQKHLRLTTENEGQPKVLFEGRAKDLHVENGEEVLLTHTGEKIMLSHVTDVIIQPSTNNA